MGNERESPLRRDGAAASSAAALPTQDPAAEALAPTPAGGDAARAATDIGSVNISAARLTPLRIGRYIVLRTLGKGGMGVVYSAYDSELDRKVAVKVVATSSGDSQAGRARVMREAQSLARLAHPNIVHVYEVGEDRDSAEVFIAMEFVAGETLAAWQKAHPVRDAVSFDACLHLYLQAAAGLDAAHKAGLIHRDFKPDNVLIGQDGRVRVVDFGLARAVGPLQRSVSLAPRPVQSVVGSGERLTRFGSILGTPGYMAPEQVRGEDADARSDQFGFCASLFEALYGRLPFAGDSFSEYAKNVLAGRRSPSAGVGEEATAVPLVVEQALHRGLSLDPAQRFSSMSELVVVLSRGLQPDAESAHEQRMRRRSLWAVCGALSAYFGYRSAVWHIKRPAVRLHDASLVVWVALAILLIVSALFRHRIVQHSSSRRVIYLGLIMSAGCALARTYGAALGFETVSYFKLELIWLATIFAREVQFTGLLHLGTVAVCGLLFLLLTLAPQYISLYHNPGYMLLAILTVQGSLATPATRKT